MYFSSDSGLFLQFEQHPQPVGGALLPWVLGLLLSDLLAATGTALGKLTGTEIWKFILETGTGATEETTIGFNPCVTFRKEGAVATATGFNCVEEVDF